MKTTTINNDAWMFILYICATFSLESIGTIRVGWPKHIHILYWDGSCYTAFQKSWTNLHSDHNIRDCLFPSNILNGGCWSSFICCPIIEEKLCFNFFICISLITSLFIYRYLWFAPFFHFYIISFVFILLTYKGFLYIRIITLVVSIISYTF